MTAEAPRRILIVAQQLREYVAQRGDLFTTLIGEGHDLTLLADPLGATEVPDVMSDRLVPWTISNHSLSISDLASQVRMIRAQIHRVRPDVCHTVHYRSAILGGLGTIGTGVPVLAEFGGVGAASTHGRGPSGVAAALARLALGGRRRIVGMVQADAHRTALRHTGIRRWVKTPGCGIALPCEPSACRDHRVLFVGRFTRAKGASTFMEIAKAVRRDADAYHADAEWMAIGSVDHRDPGAIGSTALGQMAHDAGVLLLGQLPAPETRQFIGASEVLLLPSSHPEGIPRVVIESLAHGTLVVSSAAGGMATVGRELGLPNRLPWMRVEGTDPEVWARALADAFGPELDVEAMRAEAQQWAGEHFSVETYARTINDAYQSLAEQAS